MLRRSLKFSATAAIAGALIVALRDSARKASIGQAFERSGEPKVLPSPLELALNAALDSSSLGVKRLLATLLDVSGDAVAGETTLGKLDSLHRGLRWRSLLGRLHLLASQGGAERNGSASSANGRRVSELLSSYSIWFGPSGTVFNPEELGEADSGDGGQNGGCSATQNLLRQLQDMLEAASDSDSAAALVDSVSSAHWCALAAIAATKPRCSDESTQAAAQRFIARLLSSRTSSKNDSSTPAGLRPPGQGQPESTPKSLFRALFFSCSSVPGRWQVALPAAAASPATHSLATSPRLLLSVSPHLAALFALHAAVDEKAPLRRFLLSEAPAPAAAAETFEHADDSLLSAALVFSASSSSLDTFGNADLQVFAAIKAAGAGLESYLLPPSSFTAPSSSSPTLRIMDNAVALWPLRLYDRFQKAVTAIERLQPEENGFAVDVVLPLLRSFLTSSVTRRWLFDPYFAPLPPSRRDEDRKRREMLAAAAMEDPSSSGFRVFSRLQKQAALQVVNRNGVGAEWPLTALLPMIRVARLLELNPLLSLSLRSLHGMLLSTVDLTDASSLSPQANKRGDAGRAKTMGLLAEGCKALLASPAPYSSSVSSSKVDSVDSRVLFLDRLMYRPLAAVVPVSDRPLSPKAALVEGSRPGNAAAPPSYPVLATRFEVFTGTVTSMHPVATSFLIESSDGPSSLLCLSSTSTSQDGQRSAAGPSFLALPDETAASQQLLSSVAVPASAPAVGTGGLRSVVEAELAMHEDELGMPLPAVLSSGGGTEATLWKRIAGRNREKMDKAKADEATPSSSLSLSLREQQLREMTFPPARVRTQLLKEWEEAALLPLLPVEEKDGVQGLPVYRSRTYAWPSSSTVSLSPRHQSSVEIFVEAGQAVPVAAKRHPSLADCLLAITRNEDADAAFSAATALSAIGFAPFTDDDASPDSRGIRLQRQLAQSWLLSCLHGCITTAKTSPLIEGDLPVLRSVAAEAERWRRRHESDLYKERRRGKSGRAAVFSQRCADLGIALATSPLALELYGSDPCLTFSCSSSLSPSSPSSSLPAVVRMAMPAYVIRQAIKRLNAAIDEGRLPSLLDDAYYPPHPTQDEEANTTSCSLPLEIHTLKALSFLNGGLSLVKAKEKALLGHQHHPSGLPSWISPEPASSAPLPSPLPEDAAVAMDTEARLLMSSRMLEQGLLAPLAFLATTCSQGLVSSLLKSDAVTCAAAAPLSPSNSSSGLASPPTYDPAAISALLQDESVRSRFGLLRQALRCAANIGYYSSSSSSSNSHNEARSQLSRWQSNADSLLRVTDAVVRPLPVIESAAVGAREETLQLGTRRSLFAHFLAFRDAKVYSQSLRCRANLRSRTAGNDNDDDGAKFGDAVLPLTEVRTTTTATAATAASKDIFLVHGLQGAAVKTWRTPQIEPCFLAFQALFGALGKGAAGEGAAELQPLYRRRMATSTTALDSVPLLYVLKRWGKSAAASAANAAEEAERQEAKNEEEAEEEAAEELASAVEGETEATLVEQQPAQQLKQPKQDVEDVKAKSKKATAPAVAPLSSSAIMGIWPLEWLLSDLLLEQQSAGASTDSHAAAAGKVLRLSALSYDAGIIRGSGPHAVRPSRPVPELAADLQAQIERVRGGGRAGRAEVAFLTHSFGGIMTKLLLLKPSSSFPPLASSSTTYELRPPCLLSSATSLVFFGTPHRGVSLKTAAALTQLSAHVLRWSPGGEKGKKESKDSKSEAGERSSKVAASAAAPTPLTSPVVMLLLDTDALSRLATIFNASAMPFLSDNKMRIVSVAEGEATSIPSVLGLASSSVSTTSKAATKAVADAAAATVQASTGLSFSRASASELLSRLQSATRGLLHLHIVPPSNANPGIGAFTVAEGADHVQVCKADTPLGVAAALHKAKGEQGRSEETNGSDKNDDQQDAFDRCLRKMQDKRYAAALFALREGTNDN